MNINIDTEKATIEELKQALEIIKESINKKDNPEIKDLLSKIASSDFGSKLKF